MECRPRQSAAPQKKDNVLVCMRPTSVDSEFRRRTSNPAGGECCGGAFENADPSVGCPTVGPIGSTGVEKPVVHTPCRARQKPCPSRPARHIRERYWWQAHIP